MRAFIVFVCPELDGGIVAPACLINDCVEDDATDALPPPFRQYE